MTKQTMDTFGQALAKDLIELLWKYNLRKKNIVLMLKMKDLTFKHYD